MSFLPLSSLSLSSPSVTQQAYTLCYVHCVPHLSLLLPVSQGQNGGGRTFSGSLATMVLNKIYGLPTTYTQERFAGWKENRVCLFGTEPKDGQAGSMGVFAEAGHLSRWPRHWCEQLGSDYPTQGP